MRNGGRSLGLMKLLRELYSTWKAIARAWLVVKPWEGDGVGMPFRRNYWDYSFSLGLGE